MSGDRCLALERVRAADGVGLLAERAKQTADDLCLPIQGDESLLQRRVSRIQ